MQDNWDVWRERLTEWWETSGYLPLRILVALVIGLLLHAIGLRIARRIAGRSPWTLDDRILDAAAVPSRWLVLLLSILAVPVYGVELEPEYISGTRHAISLLLIAVAVWLLMRLAAAFDHHIKDQYPLDVQDNYEARSIHTQTTVLRRTADVFLIFVGVAVAVMTFPRARELGAGLLASAGIVGIIVGLAVRPLLENLLAGLQIALTQPIKIQDAILLDGEMGHVEEINTTYVVLRLWDERRMVVPLSRFIQEPFQNWTRRSSQILGTVYLHADYSLPVAAVRDAVKQIVEKSEKWDGRVCSLQVTDATERTIQLRVLVSARTASDAWDLRVFVREQLIAHLQRTHPQCLPRARVEIADHRALDDGRAAERKEEDA